jgi:hypothetical protein
MRNHGPNTNFHEKPSHVSGRFVRLLMLFATLLAGGMAANQVAAQGLVVFSPTSASFGNVNEGGSKALSMTIWNGQWTCCLRQGHGQRFASRIAVTVTSGTPYKYVVTAVDSLGLESAFSLPIAATVA